MAARRSHSKISKLPDSLRDAINDAIVNKRLTYEKITEMIHAAGHEDVSQKSVERYGKQFTSKLESITRAKEQAKTILETSAGLKLDMAEASSSVAFQLLFDMLVNTNSGEVDKHTIAAIKTLASLERSAVSREKLKFQFDKGVDTASQKVMEALKIELEGHPDLIESLTLVVENIQSDLKAI